VLAHAISVIVLQARGARHALVERPAEARSAIDAVERTAAQALAEMRRLLAVLRAAGLPVELRIEGERRELSPAAARPRPHHIRSRRVRRRRTARGCERVHAQGRPGGPAARRDPCRRRRGALFSPGVTRRLIERFAQIGEAAPPSAVDELTAREVDVLKLVARGLANAEIARELVVSEHTVKSHVAHVLRKLDLRNRTQAVILAYESGLIRPGMP
jgi:DNA-binding CsgD family transcriptional regulator